MNYTFFILKSALEDFRRNKLRTFLTTLGILIGVLSVILLIALTKGLQIFISTQFEGLGSNLILVLPGRVLNQGKGLRPGGGTLGGTRFDEKDVAQVKKISEVEKIAPFFVKTVKVQSSTNTQILDLKGTTPEAFEISHLETRSGIFFDKNDIQKRSKVAVIGSKAAEKLFGIGDLGIEKIIKIENQRYAVIGVIEQTGDVSHDFDSAIFMPYTSSYAFNPDKKFFDIHIKIKDRENIEIAKDKIKKTLLKRYEEDDFSVIESTEILKTFNSILSAVSMLLIGIGTIALIVGGVGIMNIMYVSVIERTKEIGIRRTVGATKKDILFHFLTESVILALIGGLAGLLIASIIVFFVQIIFPASITIKSVMTAIGISSIIGIIFGVFPAKRASELSPIDAIRYE